MPLADGTLFKAPEEIPEELVVSSLSQMDNWAGVWQAAQKQT